MKAAKENWIEKTKCLDMVEEMTRDDSKKTYQLLKVAVVTL